MKSGEIIVFGQLFIMLDTIPNELLCNIVSILDTKDNLDNIDKLCKVSNRIKAQLYNGYIRRKITSVFPVKKPCSTTRCRRRGEFAFVVADQNPESIQYYCKGHAEDTMIRCIAFESDVAQTLQSFAASGQTELLKLFSDTYPSFFKDFLVKEAVLNGRVGTARWLVSKFPRLSLPDESFLFSCLSQSHSLGVKSCVTLGVDE